MLDDSSYPPRLIFLQIKLKWNFLKLLREAGNLYCKVQISEKSKNKNDKSGFFIR